MTSKIAARPSAARKLSRTRKPKELSVAEWQIGLRRQFALEQPLEIRNLGHDRVFSEFAVHNPATGRTYRVAIRGDAPGMNYCACPDYAVNTLGTCKHIEAVLAQLRRRYAAALRRGDQPSFSEVYVQYGACRSIRWAAGTDCPASLRARAGSYFNGDGALRPDAYATFEGVVRAAAEAGHELRVYDDALALIAEVRDAVARRTRLQKLYRGSGATASWKQLLKVPLYPYQRDGALFAAQAGRAIIADEMGLGKTIQAIAAAEMLARDAGVERVLIVCPTSLKSQWHHEIGQFSRRPALIIEGLSHRRHALYVQDSAFFKIVNYDVIHRDVDAINVWSPELVILDEAQRIKNWQTRAAKTVKQISSRYALVLTGTPLENRLDELHSIVEFVDRHRLGPLFAFKAVHEVCQGDSARVVGYRDLNKISQTLAPILIHRTKEEVLSQLPPRMDKNFFVPMTEPQWLPHNENREIVARLVAKWHRFHFLSEADQLRLRIALQNMRMVCDSTYLVDHETRHGVKVDELRRLLEEIFERGDQKVVIFSQWVRMNELVAEMLAGGGWGHVHLHGGVPGRQRQELVRALREDDACRVFLSTDAGGVGLNLQSAATVINMDLPWNPAVLEQRIGRVHRLGQKQPVRVVNFVAEGTIEHGMLSLLAFKRSVFNGVLDGTADQVFMGDSALGRFMKTIETATNAVPQVTPTPAEPEPPEEGPEFDERAGAAGTSAVAAGTAVSTAASGAGQGVLTRAAGAGAARGAGRHDGAGALGELLTRGAALLGELGRTLAEPTARGAHPLITALNPRMETDAATGRRELRLSLPDQNTLNEWVGRIAGLLAAFQAG